VTSIGCSHFVAVPDIFTSKSSSQTTGTPPLKYIGFFLVPTSAVSVRRSAAAEIPGKVLDHIASLLLSVFFIKTSPCFPPSGISGV
jgi:hypothetical protein